MMSRIHPTNNRYQNLSLIDNVEDGKGRRSTSRSPSVLTVWKRSSMSFQGTDGFTVFDEHGRLAFRVDNYTRNNRCLTSTGGQIVLMDGAGIPLLTLKPQILSMRLQWNGYRGDECGKSSTSGKCRVFSMRRSSSVSRWPAALIPDNSENVEAEVFVGSIGKSTKESCDFRIQGWFRRRNCKIIKSASGELVAKIARKRVIINSTTILLSDEVFSLIVQPGFDPQLIMAFVIILDRICHTPFAPLLCCS